MLPKVAPVGHVGLPAPGVAPANLCLLCGKQWRSGASGCDHARAAVHTSVCTRGQFKTYRHDAVCDVLCEMFKAVGGTPVADHWRELNASGSGTLGSACLLESGNRVDVILYGAGSGGCDIAIDVSFVCAEAHTGRGFASAIEAREKAKIDLYRRECKQVNMVFYPFVLGVHGGFGKEAKALWALLKGLAAGVQRRDWRHSWTAMSFSSVWMQKLSIAIENKNAIAVQRRCTVCSRQRALGEIYEDERQSGEYESWAEGRVGAGVERWQQ